MGPEIGRYIGEQMFRIGVILFLAGASLTALLIFGVPWLWEIAKPFLHRVTS